MIDKAIIVHPDKSNIRFMCCHWIFSMTNDAGSSSKLTRIMNKYTLKIVIECGKKSMRKIHFLTESIYHCIWMRVRDGKMIENEDLMTRGSIFSETSFRKCKYRVLCDCPDIIYPWILFILSSVLELSVKSLPQETVMFDIYLIKMVCENIFNTRATNNISSPIEYAAISLQFLLFTKNCKITPTTLEYYLFAMPILNDFLFSVCDELVLLITKILKQWFGGSLIFM